MVARPGRIAADGTGSSRCSLVRIGRQQVAWRAALFDPRFQAKQIDLQVHIEPPNLTIYADLEKLLQALRNLLENAWKFTRNWVLV